VAETVREEVREFLEKQKEAWPLWLPLEKTPYPRIFLMFLSLHSDEGLTKFRRDKEGVQLSKLIAYRHQKRD
jgi:hypothetical protein